MKMKCLSCKEDYDGLVAASISAVFGGLQFWCPWRALLVYLKDTVKPLALRPTDFSRPILMQKTETALNEKNRASVVAINAEIRRTKARLLEEIPKLQRLVVRKATLYKTAVGQCAAFLSNSDTQTDATIDFNGISYNLPAWSINILPDCKNVLLNTTKPTFDIDPDLKNQEKLSAFKREKAT